MTRVTNIYTSLVVFGLVRLNSLDMTSKGKTVMSVFQVLQISGVLHFDMFLMTEAIKLCPNANKMMLCYAISEVILTR